ncbi:MAG: AMP-binding protein [Armatimonadia bacterium]
MTNEYTPNYDGLFTDLTLGEFFEREVAAHPDRECLVYADRDLRLTYAEFNERVNRLAKGLLSIGITRGDHVGIWARNVPDWITFLYATAKIGAVLVTVNTAYKSHEVAYLLKQSDMKCLALVDGFRDVNYVDIMHELVPELRQCERGRLHSEEFPHLKSVIFVGQEKHRGMYNTSELILLGSHLPDDELKAIGPTLHCDDVVNMQYTSGTTGFPKGVMLTHRNILNNGYYIGEGQKLTGEDRVCLPVPFFHCFGLTLGLMAILTHGATTIPIEQFDPVLTLAAIQKERCTAVYGVPTMFIAEMSHPMFSMFDLTSLRTGIMAGSPCPIEAMKKVMSDMHMTEVTICYGLTEASPVFTQTTTDDDAEHKATTIGRKHPHVEVKVINPETGEEVGPNIPGEICCRGYNLMKGYYNMPEETAKVLEKDGWLHSGDLVTYDEDGYFKIVGRLKDMIIRGGENIYPREIEEFLYTVPGIKDAQVVGVPDQKYGEVVGAFVTLHDGADLTEEDVQDACRARMARYKAPRYVFFVDEFPQTASGKIQKFKLREMAAELIGAQKQDFIQESDTA